MKRLVTTFYFIPYRNPRDVIRRHKQLKTIGDPKSWECALEPYFCISLPFPHLYLILSAAPQRGLLLPLGIGLGRTFL
jgi:hypothetical protein